MFLDKNSTLEGYRLTARFERNDIHAQRSGRVNKQFKSRRLVVVRLDFLL
jgi:hypothetical protein